MYFLEVFDANKPIKELRMITKRVYYSFQNALSDVLNDDSDINRTIDDYGYGDYDPMKPERLKVGGVKPNGYYDDFHFCYANGIHMVIGEVICEDEGKEN